MNSEIGFFEVNWNNNYAGVNACNKILANEAIASSEDITAQIRAYRALYYYNLFDLYRNIPLDTTYVHEDGWTPEQSKPEDTFKWIESELKAVADKCPSTIEMGKINKYAAHMLLAKLYLNHNAWFKDDSDKSWYQKSLDEVNKVLEGPFSLAPNYNDNFVEDISKSPEIIFGIPLENKYAGGNYMANMWIHNAGRARWNFAGWATGGGILEQQAEAVRQAIYAHCVFRDAEQKPYFGWSVDLEGQHNVYDEPPGSLQLLPYYSFCEPDDEVWRNTVAMIRAPSYAYSFADAPIAEIG